ncbi:HU family DNA-binding protein [Microbispora amethystogenes]|uniref:HU family DNA-binding protein n=1 Tax=Microbispora amethystogenes TaxID=1427754 RepID=UPI0033C5A97D
MAKATPLSKADIAERAAKLSGIKPEAFAADSKLMGKALDAILEAMEQALRRGETIQFRGVLTADVVHKPARTGRNPSTGDPVQVEESWTVRFKPGAGLKGSVNQAHKDRQF